MSTILEKRRKSFLKRFKMISISNLSGGQEYMAAPPKPTKPKPKKKYATYHRNVTPAAMM